MTQHKESVEKQKERIAFEKADNNAVLHYFQKGAGEHYRLTRYESGRETIETFENV
tara:strand:+ start:211 stop:378 length:168 start_codon:yes stop_codon:yes gene_type:complete